jgi:hypothetical protein
MKYFNRPESRNNDAPSWQGKVENKMKLTREDAKFFFEQSEKFLKDTVETSNIIVTRTNTLITLIAGSLVALFGYVVARLISKQFDTLTITAIIAIVYLYLLTFYSFENTKPKTYLIPGSLPKDLFVDPFFVEGIKDENRIIHPYISEMENYQFKIEKNAELNRIRWKRYENILKAILALPLVLPLGYYIISIF